MRPAARCLEAGNAVQGRGLAATAWPEQDKQLTVFDGEVEILDGGMLTEGFLEMIEINSGHGSAHRVDEVHVGDMPLQKKRDQRRRQHGQCERSSEV